jgi:hypothetical protein
VVTFVVGSAAVQITLIALGAGATLSTAIALVRLT